MSETVAHVRRAGDVSNSLPRERIASLDLAAQLTALRVEQLRYRARGETENIQVVLLEAFRALDYAQMELAAARDELHERADQMLTTRLERELEWTRYRDLFDAAPVAYLETDARGIVIESNRACCELLNVASAQLIGKPLIVFVALSDRLNFRQTLDALIGQSKRARMSVRLQPRRTGAGIPVRTEISTVEASSVKASAVRWMFIPTPVVASELALEPGRTNARGTVAKRETAPQAWCSGSQRQRPRWHRSSPVAPRSRTRVKRQPGAV